jgi:hypothetical protein
MRCRLGKQVSNKVREEQHASKFLDNSLYRIYEEKILNSLSSNLRVAISPKPRISSF